MEETIIYTSHEFFMAQAPSFNFDLDEEQLLKKGLEAGFITKIGDDQYLQNNDY
jgi:hypothetical protein